jgi:tripartite-type tricarboxylate transporter receptor subunit TctC
LDFDPVSDLTHIICLTGYIFGIVVRADAPWRTLQELLADARARPGAIRFGSSGYGTTPHIVMMRIAKDQHVQWTHIPFKGNAGSVNALLGKHVDVVADGSSWSQLVASGEFRLLATWGESRHESWPDAPTLREIGIDIVVKAPYGLAGPRGMRPEIVSILHDAFRRGMQEERYNKTLRDLGQETLYLNGPDYRNAIKKQLEDERQILKALDVTTAQ